MKNYRGRRWTSALLLLSITALAACDMGEQQAQQPGQNQAPAQTQPGPSGQDQQPAQAQRPAQTEVQPTARSSAPLRDNQIGGPGVAVAQEQPTPTQIPAGEQNALSDYERVINNVYRRTINGVVNLTDGRATGSGFIIDREGHIVTNNHV